MCKVLLGLLCALTYFVIFSMDAADREVSGNADADGQALAAAGGGRVCALLRFTPVRLFTPTGAIAFAISVLICLEFFDKRSKLAHIKRSRHAWCKRAHWPVSVLDKAMIVGKRQVSLSARYMFLYAGPSGYAKSSDNNYGGFVCTRLSIWIRCVWRSVVACVRLHVHAFRCRCHEESMLTMTSRWSWTHAKRKLFVFWR